MATQSSGRPSVGWPNHPWLCHHILLSCVFLSFSCSFAKPLHVKSCHSARSATRVWWCSGNQSLARSYNGPMETSRAKFWVEMGYVTRNPIDDIKYLCPPAFCLCSGNSICRGWGCSLLSCFILDVQLSGNSFRLPLDFVPHSDLLDYCTEDVFGYLTQHLFCRLLFDYFTIVNFMLFGQLASKNFLRMILKFLLLALLISCWNYVSFVAVWAQ